MNILFKKTVHAKDITFVNSSGAEYKLHELNDKDTTEICSILHDSAESISKYQNFFLRFPDDATKYSFGQMPPQQLVTLKYMFDQLSTRTTVEGECSVTGYGLCPKEKTVIRGMARNNMSITATASELGVNRSTIYNIAKRIRDKTGYDVMSFHHLNILLSFVLTPSSETPLAKK